MGNRTPGGEGHLSSYLKQPCFALYDPYRRMGRGLG